MHRGKKSLSLPSCVVPQQCAKAMALMEEPPSKRHEDVCVAIDPSRREWAHGFFLVVTCACHSNISNPEFPIKRVLTLSAATFAVPAYMLLVQGEVLVGVCISILTVTSIVYHLVHSPWSRAADVTMVHVSFLIGSIRSMIALAQNGWNFFVFTSLVGAITAGFIGASSSCNVPFPHVRHTNLTQIQLPWHVVLHFVTSGSLACQAAGLMGYDL
mmetsp:Transcript_66271/g.110099  ORF Transcript_66271/g.110099 Transcript_66271/m.110099 type:complete len:214 (+) Transcript_66271:135-776(+)